MKVCTRCKIEKPVEAFGKNRNSKDGLSYYCLECWRQKSNAWADAHPERIRAIQRKHIEANREKVLKTKRDSRKRCAERPNPRRNEIIQENIRLEFENDRQRRWRTKHLSELRSRRRAYQIKRRADPAQRVVDAIRRRIRHVIRGKSKGALKLLGYSAIELRAHLEAQFQPGMSWDNYGLYGEKWHVDHKRPVCSFKLPDELKQCFALENLQPLWARENLAKSRSNGNSVEHPSVAPGPAVRA